MYRKKWLNRLPDWEKDQNLHIDLFIESAIKFIAKIVR